MNKQYHTIIIGAGVAGMTAALYLKRAGINVLLIEKEAPGGQVIKTAKIENYPGILEIEGPELAMKMYEQVTKLEVPFLFEEVKIVEKNQERITVTTSNEQLSCQNLVIATGREPRKLGIENEEKLTGKGISWCAICDGPLYRNKDVAVIGGGRAAVEEAIYLSKLCNKVTLIHRKDSFRAEEPLVDDLKSRSNIEVITPDTVVKFVPKEGKLDKLVLESGRELTVDGCFEFIGQVPMTEIFRPLGILNPATNYIEVDENLQTAIPNIYACGDCLDKDLYQIVTACSEGAIVADHILKEDN